MFQIYGTMYITSAQREYKTVCLTIRERENTVKIEQGEYIFVDEDIAI